MKKLKIRDGQNFQIYIEEKIEQDNFFYHEYEMAVKSLNDIWMEQEKSSDAKELGFSESPNNIIAFCGERGSGKSSVMLSFMKAVIRAGENDDKNMDTLQFAQEIRENDWGARIVIDPSMFDEVHNIMDIILAHIYQDFNERYEKDNQRIDPYEREKMLKLLAAAYKSLSIIRNKEKVLSDEYDLEGNITKLQKLGEGTRLKKAMEDLIAFYLELIPKFVGRKNQKCEKLLIAIDDLDLCNEYSYVMAEQIRKYLILPNVIILMAIKIEQLELGIEEKNRRDFEKTIAGRKGEGSLEEEIQGMSERYVTKLIPTARRIYLPKLDATQVCLEFDNNPVAYGVVIVENRIIRLIIEKTGMYFIPSYNNSYHYLVPENLRDFVNLYLLLNSMKEPAGSEQEKQQIKLENIYIFSAYFKAEMIKKKVNGIRLKALQEVFECDDNSQNYNMGNYLDNLLSTANKTVNKYMYDFPPMSLAAVMDNLMIVSQNLAKREDYELFYCIKIYYTILLNQRLYENGRISIPLTNGFIWGNEIYTIMPMSGHNQWLSRGRFFIGITDCWRVITDAMYEWEPSMVLDEENKFTTTNKGQLYVSDISETSRWTEIAGWLLITLLSSPYNIGTNGRTYIYKGRFIAENHAVVSPNISVSIENYFVNLACIHEFFWCTGLELLGISGKESEEIVKRIEEENAPQINQAKIIILNPDLSSRLLEYCRSRNDYKKRAEDRTYELVKRFLENVSQYLSNQGMERVDLTKFWIPIGRSEQGEIIGKQIDICTVYAEIFSKVKKNLENQSDGNNLEQESGIEANKLKQIFAQQVNLIAAKDYSGTIDYIPTYLKNKKVKVVKERLENIAKVIQRYTFREKRFPEGLDTNQLMNLYSEVVDLYMKNPDENISEKQSNEYKQIGKAAKTIQSTME